MAIKSDPSRFWRAAGIGIGVSAIGFAVAQEGNFYIMASVRVCESD